MATPQVARARILARERERRLPPARRLANVLALIPRDRLPILSEVAGVDRQSVATAWRGQRIGASAYVKLCLALGVDPATGGEIERWPRPNSRIQFWMLGAGFFLARDIRGLSLRDAAPVADVSIATISRIEQGQPVAIESAIRLAKFIGVPIAGFLSPDCVSVQVSRVTQEAGVQ